MRACRIAVVTVGSLLVLSSAGSPITAQESSLATYVTGTITGSLGTPPESIGGADVDRLVMLTDRDVEWSDPRLPSRMVARAFSDSFEGAHPEGSVWPSVNAVSYRLEGPEGAWSGVGHGFDVNPEWMPSEPGELMGAEMITLTGEGAYAGLSAILILHVDALDWGQGSFTFEGLIYDGEPPPVPEPVEPGFELPQ